MATRLYLCGATAPDAAITPAYAAWTTTASSVRRAMVPQAVASEYAGYIDALADGGAVTSTAGQSAAHRQYISLPMVAGASFVNATSTFSCQIMGLESALNDNIINRVRAVKVVSRDGTTLQATLIALGNATSVVEWSTSMRGLTFLNATTVGANYTVVAGDRLVLEVGHNDSSGVSISGTMRFGITGQTGDLAQNETDTTTTLRPWFESSVNLTFETSDPLPRNDKKYANASRDFDPWSSTGWLQ